MKLSKHLSLIHILERIAEMTEGKDFVEQRTWRTGILVFLHGSAPEKTIGWRTDIDGLPIVEETGLDFKSIHEGRMHACGHDIHMTTALGLLDQMLQAVSYTHLCTIFLYDKCSSYEIRIPCTFESINS